MPDWLIKHREPIVSKDGLHVYFGVYYVDDWGSVRWFVGNQYRPVSTWSIPGAVASGDVMLDKPCRVKVILPDNSGPVEVKIDIRTEHGSVDDMGHAQATRSLIPYVVVHVHGEYVQLPIRKCFIDPTTIVLDKP